MIFAHTTFRWLSLAWLFAMAWQPGVAAAAKTLTTGFEQAKPGDFRELNSSIGTWRAETGHAEFAQRLSRQLRKRLNFPPRFARAFGSHMVLQQGQPIAVWGTAKPATNVTVSLGGQKETTIAEADGQWGTTFPALEAKGQSLRLTAETALGKTTLNDILVGEVWLCAGQSNMEWKLSQSATAKAAIPAAKHSRLRLFNFVGAARGGSRDYPPELVERLTPGRFCSGQWRVSSPNSAAPFSAVGFFFGQNC